MDAPAPYQVRARNTASDSANRIHDDDVARSYGFRGGLVPGVDVYAYMTHAPARAWGAEWLAHGAMRARFLKPVYDGELVTVEASWDGPALALEARNPEGVVCATGRAQPAAAVPPPEPHEYPRGPLPDRVPIVTREVLAGVDFLGTIETDLSPAACAEHRAEVGETLALYAELGVGHPAHLLRTCNWILATNVQLGPWIHAQSECRHFALARVGERIQTRGRVAALHERGGHKFVELDLLIAGEDERPIMQVRHTAIYEPRPA